ncbi:thrombopoietin receptor isoform X2 [Xenopus laevis]|uniref:Thrombopoietin receptor isoform X2 n=2 Tax=Xenopus laevis TaxID=8355 RepID=A0A1L8GM88_XENLA|nr:thrombopoietin receptor isoform X2 [Xenopus laevis]OCT84886.1 hypothetical protein XELAEV_18023045mg [Xenopus laevis]
MVFHNPCEKIMPYVCVFLPFTMQLTPRSPVTEQDIDLLSSDPYIPHCFTRSFKDLTCFWEVKNTKHEMIAEYDGNNASPYGFFYSRGDEECECPLTKQNGNHTLYICEFPEKDVIMFNDLTIKVKEMCMNKTLHNRKVAVEAVGLLDHPTDINVFWTGNGNTFQAVWKISEDNEFHVFFFYEVQYWPEGLSEKYIQTLQTENQFCSLDNLQPGQLYHLRVRTKPNGPLDGFWGSWSELASFLTPQSTEVIGLHCFTPDLSAVCCNWRKNTENYKQLFYKYGGSEWLPCMESVTMINCSCVFMARSDSAVSLIMNVSSIDHPRRMYYKEPFWINHIVLPPPPEFSVKPLSGGKLELNWSISELSLAKHVVYQVRYSLGGNTTWKTLQFPQGIQCDILELTPGLQYTLQMRAKPDGDKMQGFWGTWSPSVTIKLSASAGWIIPVITISLLLIPVFALITYCVFPSSFKKLKDKLWPPLPNLHRVLDTFLTEIQKQYQPSSTLYEKPIEEPPQSSRLEILGDEVLPIETQQVSRDYVQLSPPTYQNEEYWPKIGLLLLSPNLNTVSLEQPSSGITNQTYFPTSWNQ